jgi:hypothetical protein
VGPDGPRLAEVREISIKLKWFLSGIVQGIVVGLVAFYSYKPKAIQ